jgi:hypothetical protein
MYIDPRRKNSANIETRIIMRACSSSSGGAIFIPDTLNEKRQVVSYREFLETEEAQQKQDRPKLFGRRKKNSDKAEQAA